MRRHREIPSEAAILAAKPGPTYFGKGLLLKVSPDGRRRNWMYRYKSPITGKYTETTIGSAISFTFYEASDQLAIKRELLGKGQDPVQVKRQQRVAGATFAEACDAWIKIQKQSWSDSQQRNVELRLKKHGKPLADKIVAYINEDLVEAAIKPLWEEYPRQAERTLFMWARVFDYAKHRKMREGDNPAAWKGNMEYRFSRLARTISDPNNPKGMPHKSDPNNPKGMPHKNVSEFIRRLRIRQTRGSTAAALEFQILTAARPGEVREMPWSEIDWDQRIWDVPARRMKARRPHRVMLSDRAMAILEMQREYKVSDQFVFTLRKRNALDERSVRRLMNRMEVGRYHPHNFRNSFKNWSRDVGNFKNDLVEECLAHLVGTKVEQAYRDGEAVEKRREIMEAWAEYCESAARSSSSSEGRASPAHQEAWPT